MIRIRVEGRADGGQVVPTRGEARWNGRQIWMAAHLEDQVHSDDDVEQEVAMEEPETWIVRPESEYHVAVVGYGDGVFAWW